VLQSFFTFFLTTNGSSGRVVKVINGQDRRLTSKMNGFSRVIILHTVTSPSKTTTYTAATSPTASSPPVRITHLTAETDLMVINVSSLSTEVLSHC
jgi:hypothetical protein